MALGGGTFTTQNKILPGAYINFVSARQNGADMSERGVAAAPLLLSWGPEKEVFTVTAEEFEKSCFSVFGYDYTAPELKDLRELFKNLSKGIFYRINTGDKAGNDYAEANHGGIRGNDITIVITENVNDSSLFDVKTLVANKVMDKQTAANAEDLLNNDYVMFKKDAVLSVTAGMPLTGGTDGEVTGSDYSDFLNAVESYSFNILCCPSEDDLVKSLFVAYTKRMRDEVGIKFQTVVYRSSDADYEGVISVENAAKEKASGLVYWVAGAEAGCEVNKTCENKIYNGEYTVNTNYTQTELADAVKAGKFMLHQVGDDSRVLMDINTLTNYTEEKGEDFSSNQTVRVLDQIGNDIATLFNSRYLGKVPNDDAGRISLWNDIVRFLQDLARLRAIEGPDAAAITVDKGDTKRSVVVNCPVTPVNCMSQLYMTVVVY